MISSAWDKRIARAEKLACTHSAARELLKFYAEIARFQKSVYGALGSLKNPDTSLLIPHFAPLLSLVVCLANCGLVALGAPACGALLWRYADAR